MQLLLRDISIYDADVLLEWRNEVAVRKVSHATEVITRQEHIAWLAHRLESLTSQPFWLFERGVEQIGFVRFDFDSTLNHFEIAIIVNPKLRGKGFGERILRLSLKRFFALNPTAKLYAEINKNNEASRQLFLNCDFREIEPKGNFLVFKRSANLD